MPFWCHIDAGQLAIDGTLAQIGDTGEQEILFFSKRLSPEEENYTANDRELLGIIYFLRRFRCYLKGAEFEILTYNQILYNFHETHVKSTGIPMVRISRKLWHQQDVSRKR